MALFSFGISYKTAPVSVREKVAFSSDRLAEARDSLVSHYNATEVVIVSTCNRTEVYLNADAFDKQQALHWLSNMHSLSADELADALYFFEQETTEHLMQVACGLDSMVLGEPQILGQLKQAFAQARQIEAVGSILSRLFEHSFSVAKQVRTETGIGESAVSVAFAAVSLSKHIFSDLQRVKVLLVGAGETTELVARHLVEAGVKDMIVANRSVQRAKLLAENFSAQTATLSAIPELMEDVDIVVSSTASTLPLIGKGMVEGAMEKRLNRPMFMVDLAVPRDIETRVNDVENVYLYTVDDLQSIVQQNQKKREQAAAQAEQIITEQAQQFRTWFSSRAALDYVKHYRSQADEVRNSLQEKALRQLERGIAPEKVVAELATKLTNQLVHPPTVALRQAARNQDQINIEFLAEHFGIESD